MEYYIKFIEIEISYIIIKITKPIKELSASTVKCLLNCKSYNDFTMQNINEDGSLYKILPKKYFKIYDEVELYLEEDGIYSNHIKAHLCKEYRENKGLFLYQVPQINSGNYTISLESLNDTNLKMEIPDQTICNGISEKSNIKIIENNYNDTGEIKLRINILDKKDNNAPDGQYFIYIKIEKI